MRKFFTLFCILLISVFSFGKPVDATLARKAGIHFLSSIRNVLLFPRGADLSLVYRESDNQKNVLSSEEASSYFYVFNIVGNKGFIIISGDDIAQPVLAYSGEESFKTDRIPPHVAAWLNYYRQEIQYARDFQIKQSEETAIRWEQLTSDNEFKAEKQSGKAVSPLLQTLWDQSPYYNGMCPYDNDYQEYTVTGCVATAMAQVMKYWNSPENGSGFHSYNHSKYGTLSADFGSTTYQWSSMPAYISGANTAVETLMYHCGVSVDMDYGVGETGGSSAYVVSSQAPGQNCAEYALKTYFGYNSSLQGLMRDNYSLSDWQSMLKTELDAGRPVLYAGIGSGGGHCFVCDGYDQDNYFHFNWGWSGTYDGYFQIDALNSEGVGTGGGNGGFNSYQQALFGVQPTSGGGGGQNYTLELNEDIVPSATSIPYGGEFSVHTDIVNNGTGNFSGDYCAAIFDGNGVFVDYVEIMSGMSLPAGYHYTNGLTFSNSGLLTMLPGSYLIGIYSRPAGGNWNLVDGGNHANYITLNIVNNNNIALYQEMTATPSVIVQNHAVSVHLDVANYGSSAFSGTFDVSLYDLNGYFVFTIQQLTGMNLPSGYHYTNGLDFTNSNVNVTPGTYLLALEHKPTGGSWELSGSQNYPNPILVTVQEGFISGDQYEPDNTLGTAYELPVSFSGNNAEVTTSGANCHEGNDYDYYKINLPSGYNYTITGGLHDSQNAEKGETYTLDAVFAYSLDGSEWSSVYDSDIPKFLSIIGGGEVYFLVSPKYTGSTGTYMLDLKVSRQPIGIEETVMDPFSVYPNPANDHITIKFKDQGRLPEFLELYSSEGKKMFTLIPQSGEKRIIIPVVNFQSGIYYLRLHFKDGEMEKKIVVGH
ncbi:MAG: thiol protease/hemagglutinin PrtT [Bacteroidota bacterium]|nr:thiol protease/hemagglutinin PrtT [Bacteroidota bacterium]